MQTINELKTTLEKSLNNFKDNETVAKEVLKAIDSYGNKAFNKRLATHIEKQVDGLIVSWNKQSYSDSIDVYFWGTVNGVTIEYKNRLSGYSVSDIEQLKKSISIYIEELNEVMQGVDEQKRLELKNLKLIERETAKAKKTIDELMSKLTDRQRDFGKLSYPAKDYIKSALTDKL